MAGSKLKLPSGPSRRERLAPIAEPPKPKADAPRDLGLPGPRGEESTWRGTLIGGVLGVVMVLGVGLAYRFLAAPETDDEGGPSASASASSDAPPPRAPRCAPLDGASDFLVGEAPKIVDADAGDDGADDTPFAAVLGRAIATDRGFAAPVLGDGENGSVMSVVEIDERGAGTSTRLSRSRGDLEPPVLFADGARLLGAAIEPNASGIALKLFFVERGSVAWGAEIEQPRDESLAVDIAASGPRGAVVWDAVKDEKSRIVLASFARGDVGTTTAPRAVTPADEDAEAPRLVPRSGGWYLVYRVRGAAFDDASPEPVAKKGSSSSGGDDDIDESRGEKGFASWVEALRLDENGAPIGEPERLTPNGGHVTGFDVTTGKDGFTLAWRDEDGPTGSGGGDVNLVQVNASGPSTPSTVRERGEGGAAGAFDAPPTSAGIPIVLGGWVAVPTLRGQSLLAAIDPAGAPLERLTPETSFGFGEPVARRPRTNAPAEDVLLVAEPKGRAVNLRLLGCTTQR